MGQAKGFCQGGTARQILQTLAEHPAQQTEQMISFRLFTSAVDHQGVYLGSRYSLIPVLLFGGEQVFVPLENSRYVRGRERIAVRYHKTQKYIGI